METEKTPVFLYEKSCKVTEPLGLCARPSCCIVMEVARSAGSAGFGKIFIRRADDRIVANPFSVINVMMLGACQGTELVVYTNDQGLVEKVDSLADFVNTVKLHTEVDFCGNRFAEVIKEARALKSE